MPVALQAAARPSLDLCTAQVAVADELARRFSSHSHVDGSELSRLMAVAAGSDLASGHWSIRHAYDAAEAAQMLALRRLDRRRLDEKLLFAAERIAAEAPSQTRRSQAQLDFQQFSTPLPLGLLAAAAARISDDDIVLEPSAGTGLLAVFAESLAGRLLLNELEPTRRALLSRLFPKLRVTGVDGAAIHAHLAGHPAPTVVLINPPYSRTGGRIDDRHAAARHVRAAIEVLAHRGRCAAILPSGFCDGGTRGSDLSWIAQIAAPVLNVALPPRAYNRHGTGTAVRLVIFDKDSTVSGPELNAASCAEALSLIERTVPPRGQIVRPAAAVTTSPARATIPTISSQRIRPSVTSTPAPATTDAEPLDYMLLDEPPPLQASQGLYQPYRLSRVLIAGAQPHPTPLVESLAMAAVLPPKPSYRPTLPASLVSDGILSDAQLETLIYAGEAHAELLPGWFRLAPDTRQPVSADPGSDGAFQYRRGYLLGDGTGCGKGRQLAGIIRDNWAQGRTRSAWLSLTDELQHDAKRDWAAMGGLPADVVPLSRFRPGEPITLSQGILFTTFATLRQTPRLSRMSRVDQIVEWLGPDFDGVIVLDEAHAMANALPSRKARGVQKASAQGLAGLALQHRLPNARIVYSSATDATEVRNLGYLDRLGLWGHISAPFPDRESFVGAMERGGVAAAELVARDLKAMGLKTARALSFAGTEQEIVEHKLTPPQIAIYDAFAFAFEVIHNNLRAALEAIGAIDPLEPSRRDSRAISAAHSAFESQKQRFFNSLLTGMKCPTLIARMRADLDAGHACVIQLISTGAAMLDRRLGELGPEDYAHLDIDTTPREGVVTYLQHSFPIQMMQAGEDADRNYCATPLYDDAGRAIICPEAVRLRDELIEQLCALPAVPAALDQIIAAFGEENVAEVTGRSRRLVVDTDGRQQLQRRPASANLSDAQAFQDDRKRSLVFSQAGGTGRSYHADRGARNQRHRHHFLLEAGWQANVAIQGFGRTHRTNQVSAPLYLPISTDVKAERRFISTIARRLDSLGALTRGQRQTGGQGLFKAEDNLESDYAIDALHQWYGRLAAGYIQAIGLAEFERRTGLRLTDRDGCLLEDLPPIQRWLNRLLALPIALQNAIFEEYEDMIAARILAAREAGHYDEGIENLPADRISIVDERVVRTDPKSGAETVLVRLQLHARQRFANLDQLLAIAGADPVLLVNAQSGAAAVRLRAPSFFDDEDGHVETRYCLERPRGHEYLTSAKLDASHWQNADPADFHSAWFREVEAHRYDERTTDVTMLTGLILPVWKHLEKSNLMVRRAILDDGRSLLGPVLDEPTTISLLRDLGHQVGELMTPALVWASVMARRATIECAQGVKLRKAVTLGVDRFEIVDIPPGDLPVLKGLGIITEIHQFRTRLFVPDGNRTDEIIAALLERYPPVG